MVDDIGRDFRFDQTNAVQRRIRLLAGTRPMAWLLARVLHHLDGPVLRRSRGRRSVTSALTGLPIVELTAIGAQSGEPRTLPIVGVPDGDERKRLWELDISVYPPFKHYARRAGERRIPVMVLQPLRQPPDDGERQD